MSSATFIKFDADTIGVPYQEFVAFCNQHGIIHSPRTIGGNVFYAGQVEIHFGDETVGAIFPERAHRLVFSTYFMGAAIPDVARLANLAWQRWGGSIEAAPEVRLRFETRPSGGD